jgi:hypothetical protein
MIAGPLPNGGPPNQIYVIRHGEKPADPPTPTAAPTPPFGVDVNGNQSICSLLPRGWQRSGARGAVRARDRTTANRLADTNGPGLTRLWEAGQDTGTPHLRDDSGLERTAERADQLSLRRRPGVGVGQRRGRRLHQATVHDGLNAVGALVTVNVRIDGSTTPRPTWRVKSLLNPSRRPLLVSRLSTPRQSRSGPVDVVGESPNRSSMSCWVLWFCWPQCSTALMLASRASFSA